MSVSVGMSIHVCNMYVYVRVCSCASAYVCPCISICACIWHVFVYVSDALRTRSKGIRCMVAGKVNLFEESFLGFGDVAAVVACIIADGLCGYGVRTDICLELGVGLGGVGTFARQVRRC